MLNESNLLVMTSQPVKTGVYSYCNVFCGAENDHHVIMVVSAWTWMLSYIVISWGPGVFY